MRSEPILIGPCCVGKSTVSVLLAESMGVPRVSMDEVRFGYYEEIGYDAAYAERLQAEGGFRAKYEYWKPFEVHAVERMLSDYGACVFDFGGGHSVYEDPVLFARARRALSVFRNVVLLLPFRDAVESVEFLRPRYASPVDPADDINEHFVRHPSNRRLATQVVYTGAREAAEVRDEILALL
jgi:shikimate kinase